MTRRSRFRRILSAADRCAVNADDSARVRDLLASNRTLLAWVRTALLFAALGFAVTRFGLRPGLFRLSDYLEIFLVVVALLVATAGFIQYRAIVRQERPPPGAPQPVRWPADVAIASCLLTCALLIVYLAIVYLAIVYLAIVYLAIVYLAIVYLAIVYLAIVYLAIVYLAISAT